MDTTIFQKFYEEKNICIPAQWHDADGNDASHSDGRYFTHTFSGTGQ